MCENGLVGGEAGTVTCKTTPKASFPWPITLNIYNVEPATNEPGPLIATATQTVNVPYRPSASKKCPTSGPQPEVEAVGGWRHNGQCLNGMAFEVNYSGTELTPVSPATSVKLPEEVIIAVTYKPEGKAEPLNVGLTEASFATPTVGGSPLLAAGEAYMTSPVCEWYGTAFEANCGKFGLSEGWATYQPVLKVTGRHDR
jgi:hypothetical protein